MPLNTRSVTKSTRSVTKAGAIPKVIKKINSPNCSVISISRQDSDEELAPGKFTSQDIISDLRNKLATAYGKLTNMETEYKNLKSQLKEAICLNNTYATQLAEHKKTIEILSNKIHSRTLVEVSTQTEFTVALPTHVNKQDRTSQQKPTNVDAANQATSEVNSKHKILLLSDSHGRNLAQMLKTKVNPCNNRFSIESICKPNATFGQVTEDVKNLTKDFNKDDYIIITAGVNDTELNIFKDSVLATLNACFHTNILINTIPYRYDNLRSNSFIFSKNKFLFDLSMEYKFRVIDINMFLSSEHYTRYGLHLNVKGKVKISEIIIQFLDSSINFYTSKNQIIIR